MGRRSLLHHSAIVSIGGLPFPPSLHDLQRILPDCAVRLRRCKLSSFKRNETHWCQENDEAMNTHTDPVCGMTVDPATAAGKFDYEGQTYYFCSAHCLRKFSADPQGSLTRAPQPMAHQRRSVNLVSLP